MAGQSAKMVPVLRGEILHTQKSARWASAYFYTTIEAASSKFDEFLAKRSQFDIDHDQIWQAYADRSGNGSYLKKNGPMNGLEGWAHCGHPSKRDCRQRAGT